MSFLSIKGDIMGLFKTLIGSLVFLTTVSSFAAPASLYSYVLSHPTIAEMENTFPKKVSVQLVKIEQVATYRCPNCFDIRLTYSGLSGKKPLKFSKVIQTRGQIDNTIEVTVLKP